MNCTTAIIDVGKCNNNNNNKNCAKKWSSWVSIKPLVFFFNFNDCARKKFSRIFFFSLLIEDLSGLFIASSSAHLSIESVVVNRGHNVCKSYIFNWCRYKYVHGLFGREVLDGLCLFLHQGEIREKRVGFFNLE